MLANIIRVCNMQRPLCKLKNPVIKYYSTQLTKPNLWQSNILKQPVLKNREVSLTSQLLRVSLNGVVQKRLMSGDHSQLWKIERIVAAAFLPLLPACFLLENSVLEGVLAILTVMHTHWGLEAIIIDYARPSVVGNVVPKLLMGTLYLTSILTVAGLLVLIFNGPGLIKVIKQGWAIGKD